MSTQDDARPDDVDEADYAEQHVFADGTEDDGEVRPDLDREDEADVADLQEQAIPAPADDDDRR
jgi:hypothetical protein